MPELSDIVVSRVRVKILNLFLSDPREMYHVRGIVRETSEEINAVRRELSRMEKNGLLKKEPRGNRVYYWLNSEYPFYQDLLSIITKSTGLGASLLSNKNKLGKIHFIMFSGRFARRKERKVDGEVDVLIVGEVVLPELANLVRVEESKRNREINYTVMSRDELDFRKKRRDPFLQGILLASRVMVFGDEEELIG